MAGPLDEQAALRWRLVLGRHAEEPLPLAAAAAGGDSGEAAARDRSLSFLYDREQRSHRPAGGGAPGVGVPEWIRGLRTLFPREAVEVLERDALVRYGLEELVTEPEVLRGLEPTEDLVKVLLAFKDRLRPEVLPEARRVVREVVERLAERVRHDLQPALAGASARGGRPIRSVANTDWRRTVRRNLRHWDPARQRLVADRISFRSRQRRRPHWRVIVAVDQSGSMLDGLIHAAVVAAVLAALPAVTVDLLVWDHRVVDLSDRVRDPLEVLMSAQLGGGTRLLPALQACAAKVTAPERTVLAVISDFRLYDAPEPCLALARELSAAGVEGLGLCAVDPDGRGVYDERFARALADCGWWVGAVTPRALVRHLAGRLG